MGCDSMIELRLPYPPSVNQYYRKFRNTMVISERGRKFLKEVKLTVGAVTAQVGRLRVEIEVYPPDRRKRDIDNVCKATLDALAKAGVYQDDSQIDVLLVTRMGIVSGGCLEVKVQKVKQSESKQRKASKVSKDLDLRRAGSRQVDIGKSVPKPDIFKSRGRDSRS
jgi:crossover junction endodeoxyribonuclease RusA